MRNSWLDHVLRLYTTAGLAITGLWLGIMLQLFFVMDLDLLPLGGRVSGPKPHAITGFFTLDALLTLDGAAFLSALQHLQATLGLTLWAGVAYSLANRLVDITQVIIDPRTVRR
jgi:ABC-type dipeptide/oligopeptide/nickel transport system permease component